jgi:hypothetical protein
MKKIILVTSILSIQLVTSTTLAAQENTCSVEFNESGTAVVYQLKSNFNEETYDGGEPDKEMVIRREEHSVLRPDKNSNYEIVRNEDETWTLRRSGSRRMNTKFTVDASCTEPCFAEIKEVKAMEANTTIDQKPFMLTTAVTKDENSQISAVASVQIITGEVGNVARLGLNAEAGKAKIAVTPRITTSSTYKHNNEERDIELSLSCTSFSK